MIKFRIICLFVIFITLSIFVSACSNNLPSKTAAGNQPTTSSSEAVISSTSTESSVVNQSSGLSAVHSSQSTNSQATESFMGKWTITKLLFSNPRGSTYDSETINKLIGRELTFTSEKATCFGDDIKYIDSTILNPVYTKETLSNDDMNVDYRVNFKNLGITTNSIIQVTISSANGACNTFLIIDNNTLILTGGGDFFQLKRSN